MHWKHWNGIIHIFGAVLCGIDPAAVFGSWCPSDGFEWPWVVKYACRTHTERSLPTTTALHTALAMPTTATSALSMVYVWNDGVIDFHLTCRWTCISNYICRVVCPCFSVCRAMHMVYDMLIARRPFLSSVCVPCGGLCSLGRRVFLARHSNGME